MKSPRWKRQDKQHHNSLIDKGYVTCEQNGGEKGKFNSIDLEVHETPIQKEGESLNIKIESTAPSTTKISPYLENPDAVNPYPDEPSQYNTYKSNIHESTTSPASENLVVDEDLKTLFSDMPYNTDVKKSREVEL